MKSITDSYISIDLETTGLNPKHDHIIEIGAVKVVEGEEKESFSSLVCPDRRLSERVTELTGLTDEALADAPSLDQVMGQLTDFLGDLPLLGHRILFDYSFLKKAAVDRRLSFEKQGIDTLKIARKYLESLPSRTLPALCEYYDISLQAHRALNDARAASCLYQIFLREFADREEEGGLFVPKPLIFKVKRDTPATRAQKERLYRLLDKHRIESERDVEKLSRSEADRMIDKLLARYGVQEGRSACKSSPDGKSL